MSYRAPLKTVKDLSNSARFERGYTSFEVIRRRIIAKYLISSSDELEMEDACVRIVCCELRRIRNECSLLLVLPVLLVLLGASGVEYVDVCISVASGVESVDVCVVGCIIVFRNWCVKRRIRSLLHVCA
jgi:hypothetical protein